MSKMVRELFRKETDFMLSDYYLLQWLDLLQSHFHLLNFIHQLLPFRTHLVLLLALSLFQVIISLLSTICFLSS